MKKIQTASNLNLQHQLVQQMIDRQQYPEAEKKLRGLLLLQPNHIDLLTVAAGIAKRLNKPDEARRYYLRALKIQPGNIIALNGIGLLCYDAKDYESAEKYYIETFKSGERYAVVHNNYAALLRKQGRYNEAATQYQMALAVDPHYEEAAFGLACSHILLEQLNEAEHTLLELLQKKPGNTRYLNTLAMLLLRKGNFVEGWALYRARYSPSNSERAFSLPNYPYTYWDGEDLTGKTILIQSEQGLGDEIQFCRYLSRLKHEKNAARIIYVCSESLVPLFSSISEIDLLISGWGETAPEADYWSILLDLPLHFATSPMPFGDNQPYIQADPLMCPEWAIPTVSSLPLKVGVVWRGAAKHINDRHRSLPSLSSLKPLWDRPNIQWVSLQKGPGEEEALKPDRDQPIVALGHKFTNYADTAAALEQLDLVITVDTSVAHLAGAMGKPCWVILPAAGIDWRWTFGRTDSLWYPNMRLFSRTQDETLDETIAGMNEELEKWVQEQLS
ncbi:tetratricopeptide repeat protein [Enterobacteriaceae bacterium H11S18]|uniref:tetratricopeptide repeat-containing glycosyltransferase family protein n=1 Tax=Dryocola clanedunensis TaxID=2925396 RepID=UPI0022EFE5E9|nr:tetratricopeptide repeat protein [Dryocola clanedunensis]MCT4706639.1 tetratricopeptide repeat protein [Dryocola clanedunensis]MCT4712166.1 tetratricopeptide repeat protein [Dryocola clanedunensis]